MKIAFIVFLNFICFNNLHAQSDPNELTKNVAVEDAMQHFNNASSTFVSFSSKEDTKGSRYYFPNWVKGSVVDVKNTVYNSPVYFYNFDKINHHLFMTADKKQVVEIDPEQLQSFTLNNSGAMYAFKRIDAIDPNKFFQVLTEDSLGYSAYKVTRTKFQKANYHTDGMVETGKNYDEYVDETDFYIHIKKGEYRKVDLTRKSMAKAFADVPEAQAFFKEHKDDDLTESYFLDLVGFLNAN